jgi:ribosome biogenesis GTPase / thiamine phosphate phosphatase
MEGTVYKSTGTWYVVRDKEGEYWDARIKGKLKMDFEIKSTNPMAVGDVIAFDIEDADKHMAVITAVAPRSNYIVRVSPRNPNQKHIIAANMDLAVLIASMAEPRTSSGFVDRFLVTAAAYHIPACIVVNKVDILDEDSEAILALWNKIYPLLGYPVFAVSATHPETLKAFSDFTAHKTVLLSGHSGVGKSTLINALVPGIDTKVNAISGWSRKGQHTTTFSEMFERPDGGNVIDTPGIKEFGLVNFEQEELSHYFPEMNKLLSGCKFNNCKHYNEPDCAIKDAVIAGKISYERYKNYLSILDSIEKTW